MVFGASSIGALRAVELYDYGMIGLGTVFDMFWREEVIADDEVAVTYDPDTFVPLSEAMINIRVALQRAYEGGIIDERSRVELIRLAKASYYPNRSWHHLWRVAEGRIDGPVLEKIRGYIKQRRPDVKGDDARLLLQKLARELDGPKADTKCDSPKRRLC
jgi:hypothetical protein